MGERWVMVAYSDPRSSAATSGALVAVPCWWDEADAERRRAWLTEASAVLSEEAKNRPGTEHQGHDEGEASP